MQEIRKRKEKLAELQAAGKYENRQAAHQDRIDRLERSIGQLYTEYAKEVMRIEGIEFDR